MIDPVYVLVITTVVVVLIFDYTNGFHDASNMVATTVASRALTPIQAVILIGAFHFVGPLVGGTAVANTIGKFVTLGEVETLPALTIILCGLTGAIVWNVVTWWFGIPSSSSHALVGGLVGGVVVAVGVDHVVWGFTELLEGRFTGVTKVLLALIVSPIVGFWAGFVVHRAAALALRRARPSVNRYLRGTQWVTSAGLAFSHGTNDAQKSMGIITMVLLLGGFIDSFIVPFWVVVSCAAMITLGTLSGGWRIVRTVGFGIYKVRPLHALNAQVTSGALIWAASLIGAPVSTTHVVSSSIMGIGASERPKAVRWAKAREILRTWVITIPGAAAGAIVTFFLVRLFTDVV
jgi:PiT family inorganic phosphate transporter